MGDDDATFNGLRGCLRKVIYSSWAGFANFGCDIGGYRGSDSTKDRRLFLRWAQLGAFLPLMENGGAGEHRPWEYDAEVTREYRRLAVEHHRLSAYLHSSGADAMQAGISLVRAVDTETILPSDISRSALFPQPRTYSYRLGPDLLVHPAVYDMVNRTDIARVRMEFPTDAASSVWLDYWRMTCTWLTRRATFASAWCHCRRTPCTCVRARSCRCTRSSP